MTSWRAGLLFFVLNLLGLLNLEQVVAFSNDRSDNLAVYWGQDGAGHQQRLSFYCQDDTIDAIPLAFLYVFFGDGGKPVIDFANICSQGGNEFPNSDLADCSFLASDIKQCQANGKLITISLGGATAKVGFNSASQAEDFAETVWDMFLGGKSNTRPFGSAVLDGIDLDIESGSPAFYSNFVNRIRQLEKGSNKRYYVTAAPQCPFPDAKVGNALDNSDFDAVYVQFYNNYCETSEPSEFNFATWDHWAKTQSANPNVKVYLGAPASPKAAGSGYVDSNTLIAMARSVQKKYTSFGGVMLWDADTARSNDGFDSKIKNGIRTGGKTPPTTGPPDTGGDDGPDTSSGDGNDEPDTKSTKGAPSVSSSSVIPMASLPADFRDPRAKSRVKRPKKLVIESDGTSTFQRRALSRFFRF